MAKTMEALSRLVSECERSKGGVLLGKLFVLVNAATDHTVAAIYTYLAEKAFLPYVEMLSKWVYEGEVDDLYQEFLVRENREVDRENINKDFRDNFWD
jgi:hypothetical protein